MNNLNKIVCFGEILWDVFPTEAILGGAPLNVAFRLSALCNDVTLFSRIGNDNRGEAILQRMEDFGLRTQWIQKDFVHPTGIVKVSVDTAGVAGYNIEFPAA